MKKNMILAVGAVLVAAAFSAFVYVNNEKNSIDDLFNANVEVLARNETDSGTCCEDYNSSCELSWVTIPSHYLKSEGGPCGDN